MTFLPTYTFEEALARPHTKSVTAEAWRNGVLAHTFDVALDGKVSVDRSAKIRRSCSLSLVDETGELVPDAIGDLLAAPTELRLRRGLYLPDGTLEDYALGVYNVSVSDVRDTGDALSIDVTGYDRARRIARNRWAAPYVLFDGVARFDVALAAAITNRYPTAVFSFSLVADVPPLTVVGLDENGDPWEDFTKAATAVGHELFFDRDGVCTLRPEPDPYTQEPAYEYAEGEASVLLEVGRTIDDDPGYNGVIVRAEGSGVTTPIRSEAWDDDPTSPTYYLGDWGKVPRFYSSSLITTQAQADAVAAALLRRYLGATESVNFSIVANPKLDVGDVVELTRARAGLTAARYVVESFDIPLGGDVLTATTRKRQTA